MSAAAAEKLLMKRGLVPELSERAAEHLVAAAERGDHAIVEAYLDLGFSPNATGRYFARKPLLVAAAEGNHADVIRLLAARGADLNATDTRDTALQTAVNHGHLGAARTFVELGARTDVASKGGWTPLSRAVKDANRELVSSLIQSGASPEGNPCAMAFALGHDDDWFLDQLLSINGQVEADVEVVSGKSPLMYAVLEGNLLRVEKLLAAGASVHRKNRFGWTARMMAEQADKAAMVEKLAAAGAEPTPPGYFEALKAASSGDVAALNAALDAGAPVDLQNRAGVSLVTSAAGGGHAEAVRLLAKRGANLDLPEQSGGVNALAFSLMRGKLDVAEVLLELGANPKECAGASLNASVKGRRPAWLSRLLDAGASVNASDSLGQTPLFWAANKGFDELVQLLLEWGANVDSVINVGDRPLHTAVRNGHERVVELLLAAGADPQPLNDAALTPLRLAVEKVNSSNSPVHKRIFRRLVLGGANPLATVIGLTAVYDNYQLENEIEAYLTSGTINRVAAALGMNESATSLAAEISARSGDMPDEFYRALLDELTTEGFARLFEAGKLNQAFLRVGVDWNKPKFSRISPLVSAVRAHDLSIIEKLIAAGCDPNQPDEQGDTPLIAAARFHNADIMRALLSAGADPNLRSRTIWDSAQERGETVSTSADATVEEIRAENAKWASATVSGKDADCENRGMLWPLKVAATRGTIEIFDVLLHGGAKVDRLPTGPDALHEAVKMRASDSVRWLLRHGADPNRHLRGRSPLFEAVERDEHKLVEMLLEAGADPDITLDDNGQSPLLIACSRGRTDIIDALLRAGADANHENFLGETAFDLASSRGVCEHLLTSPLAKLSQKLKNWAQRLMSDPPERVCEVPMPGILGKIARREIGFGDAPRIPPTPEDLQAAIRETDRHGDNAVMYAVMSGDGKLVEALIEAGANPNQANTQGDTAGTYATLSVPKEVQIAIKRHCKANVMQQVGLYDRVEKFEGALKAGNLSLVKQFISDGTNSLHVLRGNRTPLTYAIECHDEQMVKLLLDLGADPNAAAANSWLPLMVAARDGDKEAKSVQILLEAGADPWRRSGKVTALYFAVTQGNTAALKLLLQAMGAIDWQLPELRYVLEAGYGRGRVEALAALRKAGAPTG